MPALISEQPDLRAYRAAVTSARKAWSILTVADVEGLPCSHHRLASTGPLKVSSSNTHNPGSREVIDALVARGALRISGPPLDPRYTISEDGQALLAKLTRWMHFEGCAVADWLGES